MTASRQVQWLFTHRRKTRGFESEKTVRTWFEVNFYLEFITAFLVIKWVILAKTIISVNPTVEHLSLSPPLSLSLSLSLSINWKSHLSRGCKPKTVHSMRERTEMHFLFEHHYLYVTCIPPREKTFFLLRANSERRNNLTIILMPF